MKIEFKENEIILVKALSKIDHAVLDFSDILINNNIRCALFAGYIPDLFGKDKKCEYVDIMIRNISFEKFLKLWLEIENTYECRNSGDPVDAYNAYVRYHHAVRFVKKDDQIPEFRINIIKNDIDRFILKYRRKVILGDRILFICPFEIQIPYSLFQGSQEDIDDARYLYKLSMEKLNMTMTDKFLDELNIPKETFEISCCNGFIPGHVYRK